MYLLVDGRLSLRPERHEPRGWPEGIHQRRTLIFKPSDDQIGWFHGSFDGPTMAGVAILESRFIGQPDDMLQLLFPHLSHEYRDRAMGRQLSMTAAEKAKRSGVEWSGVEWSGVERD